MSTIIQAVARNFCKNLANVSCASKTKVEQILMKEGKHDYISIIHNDQDKKTYIIEILQASTSKQVVSLKGHTGDVSCVAFSASGNQVLSGSEDKTLRLWDMPSGKLLNTFIGHTEKISCVTFNTSGSKILSGSFDKTLRLWDVMSGHCLEIFAGHKNNAIKCVAFNTSGNQILSGSYGGILRLWDVTSGYCLRTFDGHRESILCVAFNADGSQALSGSYDKTLRLWDVVGGQLLKTFVGHSSSISCVAFNDSGSKILSGCWDGILKMWDVRSGQYLKTFVGHTDIITNVAFNARDKQILSCSGDKTLRLWDIESDKYTTLVKCSGNGYFYSFSPTIISEQLLVTGVLADGIVSTINETKDSKEAGEIRGHVAVFRNNYFKKTFIIEILDASTQKKIASLNGHTNRVSCVVFNVSGSQALSGSVDKTVRLWNVATSQTLKTFTGHTDTINCVAYNANGTQVLSGSDDKTLRLWDVANGQTLRIFAQQHGNKVSCLAFNNSGSQVVSGSWDQTLRLWDVVSGKCLETFRGHTKAVICVAFNVNDRQILSGSDDKTLRLWNVSSGFCLEIFVGHTDTINCVAFNASGKQIVSGSDDKTLRLWDTTSGRCLRIFRVNIGVISSVAFSAGRGQVLSSSRNGTLLLWNIVSGQCHKLIEGLGIEGGHLYNFSPTVFSSNISLESTVNTPINLVTISRGAINAFNSMEYAQNNLDISLAIKILQNYFPGSTKIIVPIIFSYLQGNNEYFNQKCPSYFVHDPILPSFCASDMPTVRANTQLSTNSTLKLPTIIQEKSADQIVKSKPIPIMQKIFATFNLYSHGMSKLNREDRILQLLDILNNGDNNTKVAAALALGEFGPKLPEASLGGVSAALTKRLKIAIGVKCENLREAIIQVLSKLKLTEAMQKEVCDTLIDILNVNNSISVSQSLGMLSASFSEGNLKKLTDTLLTLLMGKDQDYMVRAPAARALGEVGISLPENIMQELGQALLIALNNKDTDEDAIFAMEPVLEKLSNRLSDSVVRGVGKFFIVAHRDEDDLRVQPKVLKALSARLPVVAINELSEAFIAVLEDKHWQDTGWERFGGRVIAAQALGELDTRLSETDLVRVGDVLFTVLRDMIYSLFPDKTLWEAVIEAIGRLSIRLTDLKKECEIFLIDCSNSPSEALKNSGERALIKLNSSYDSWKLNNNLERDKLRQEIRISFTAYEHYKKTFGVSLCDLVADYACSSSQQSLIIDQFYNLNTASF